jgi:LysM repeat protein
MRKYLVTIVLAAILSIATVGVVSAQGGETVHFVKFGEGLYGIAAQYGVSAQAIMEYNGIANADLIFVGQPLVIPDAYNDSMYYDGPSSSHGCQNYHIVTPGQTLSDIAYDYGLTIRALLNHNNLYDSDLVYVGQRICLPTSKGYQPKPASYRRDYGPPADAYYHPVTTGETLHIIAERYGVSYLDIMRTNNVNKAGFIIAGQRLAIPGYRPASKPHYSPAPVYDKPYKKPYHTPPPVPAPPHGPPPYHPPLPPTHEPAPPLLYLRLGRNVGYEEWGRPEFGLDDCVANLFDDGDPVNRFNAEVILTNNSVHTIPSDWAAVHNVIFHTLSGQSKTACKHRFDQRFLDENQGLIADKYSMYETPDHLPPFNLPLGGFHPPDLEPGQTADVTFYTHLERGDLVTKMEFVALGICFDPNSGDRVSCNLHN